MLITESKLRAIIRSELRKDVINEDVLRMLCKPLPAGNLKLACYGATWLYARIPYTEFFAGKVLRSHLPAATSFLGASPAVAAVIGTAAGVLSAFTFVYGTFMALPEIMSAQMEFLDSVKGLIMSQQKQRLAHGFKGPLEFGDLSAKRTAWIPSLGNISWDRDSMIDFLAAGADTKEGRSIIGKLTASGNWKMPGAFLSPGDLFSDGYPGPIIGESLAIKIQQRRKEMVDEATDKMRDELVAKVKMSYESGDFEKIIEFAKSMGWDGEETA